MTNCYNTYGITRPKNKIPLSPDRVQFSLLGLAGHFNLQKRSASFLSFRCVRSTQSSLNFLGKKKILLVCTISTSS